MTRRPMKEWSEDELIEYLDAGLPAISRDTALQELQLRISRRNQESAIRMESSTKRIEIATWIILAATIVQAASSVIQLFR